jgi:hypothetical protein
MLERLTVDTPTQVLASAGFGAPVAVSPAGQAHAGRVAGDVAVWIDGTTVQAASR